MKESRIWKQKRLAKEHVAVIKKLEEERRAFKYDAEGLKCRLASVDLSPNDKRNYNHS